VIVVAATAGVRVVASQGDQRAVRGVIVGERIVARLVLFLELLALLRRGGPHEDRLGAVPATDALAREVIGDAIPFPAAGAFDRQDRLLFKSIDAQ
jgi:hypothetical protein